MAELMHPAICPKCGKKGSVIDTRPRNHVTWRKRKCINCENKWYTYEYSLNKNQKYAIDNLLANEKESRLVTLDSIRDYICIGESNEGDKIMVYEKTRYVKIDTYHEDSELSIKDKIEKAIQTIQLPENITRRLKSTKIYLPFVNDQYNSSSIEINISNFFTKKRNLQCIGKTYIMEYNKKLVIVDAARGEIIKPFVDIGNGIVATRPIFLLK